MRLPNAFILTVGWIVLWIANALLAPVVMMVIEMVGGIISVFVGLGLIFGAAGIVIFGAGRSWHAASQKMFVAQALAPAIAIGLSAVLLTKPAAELSWQALHGPRLAPIWTWP
jgi:hypothetical protein